MDINVFQIVAKVTTSHLALFFLELWMAAAFWCAGVSQDDRVHTTCQEEDHQCAGRRELFVFQRIGCLLLGFSTVRLRSHDIPI